MKKRIVRISLFTTRISINAILLIVMMLLLIEVPGLHGYVLCIGDDGHVSVEAEVKGSCAAASTPALDTGHSVALSGTEDEDHCGKCIDIAISSTKTGDRIASKKFKPTQDKNHLSLSPSGCLQSNPPVSLREVSLSPSLINISLPEQKTVLRI